MVYEPNMNKYNPGYLPNRTIACDLYPLIMWHILATSVAETGVARVGNNHVVDCALVHSSQSEACVT
jgi:hypothetical protein